MKNPVHHIWLIFQQLTMQRSVPTWLGVLFVGSMVSNNFSQWIALIFCHYFAWKFFSWNVPRPLVCHRPRDPSDISGPSTMLLSDVFKDVFGVIKDKHNERKWHIFPE